MPSRVRKVSKNKVLSEMEILEKAQILIHRYFQESRHTEDITGGSNESEERRIWRKYSKDRMKTVSVALVFCLHIGVDPPDAIPKPNPCAKLEGWIDPFACHPQRAVQRIANSVQKAYERWQPRARYKVATDPTIEEVRKLCLSMRRNAKEERVLFHYNGHGVPRPTANGEIWVFNKTFTQYIPLSIYDLQTWLEYPCIYVWDCSSAETIINLFNRFGDDHHKEWVKALQNHQENSSERFGPITSGMSVEEQAAAVRFSRKQPDFKVNTNQKDKSRENCIHLAACRADERLPTHPDLPADLFTSCLTAPIQTSILWYLVKSGRRKEFKENILEELPGNLQDRRTILGELNWIFTAIADTIAWNSLPKEEFQRLFRQDILLASLFRSFILAEKIMGENGCGVVSVPPLPSTSDHPLWEAWYYTIDSTLNFLLSGKVVPDGKLEVLDRHLIFHRSRNLNPQPLIEITGLVNAARETQTNRFFVEQLRAFEVWLDYGPKTEGPPQQLPVVLQVLLSQAHRVRALELMSRFLDLGQWAVDHSLTVGIFPYVQKLLQSNSRDLKQWLGFIWAKILAVEPSCQHELFKPNEEPQTPPNQQQRYKEKVDKLRYHYFMQIVNDPETTAREKIVPCFILASLFHNNYKLAQEQLTEKGYVNLCTGILTDPASKDSRLLKLWVLIGLGRLWADFNPARWQAVRLDAYSNVLKELEDSSPEVRAAAVYSLGCLVKNRSEDNEHASYIDQQICDGLCQICTLDGSVLVRVELVVSLQWFIIDFEQRFAKVLLSLVEKLGIDLINEEKSTYDEDHYAVDIASTLPRVDPDRFLRANSFFLRRRERNSFYIEEIHPLKCTPASDSFAAKYRQRAQKQISFLENKAFLEPLERTWLSVLRLSLDPFVKVATMAQVLVHHIEEKAVTRKTAVDEKILQHADTGPIPFNVDSMSPVQKCLLVMDRPESPVVMRPSHSSENDDQAKSLEEKGGVMFTVGSPAGNALSISTHPRDSPLAKAVRKHSMPASSTPRTFKMEPRRTKDSLKKLAALSNSNFTPKRVTTQKRDWKPSMTPVTDPIIKHDPLVKSGFVDWCTRVFIEPILDVIQSEDIEDSASDRVLTQVNPTDWAYHTREGLIQTAENEFNKLEINTSQPIAYTEHPLISSMAMSLLRKYLYCSDGDSIYIYRMDQKRKELRMEKRREFSASGENPFCKDTTTSLLVINDMSREMILCGSNNGTIRIWDPVYNVHSHEFESDKVKLITCALPMYEPLRLPIVKDANLPVLYDWCQESGRLICGGNVKVVRIWDAHYEQTVRDINVGVANGPVTALSAELDNDSLVAVGFRNGVTHVHDVRLPTESSRILRYEEPTQAIIGCSFATGTDSTRLFSASASGQISVFDPRMFLEPLREFQLDLPLERIDVHHSGNFLACTVQRGINKEIHLYDASNSKMGGITYLLPRQKYVMPHVAAVAMHPMRPIIAVADMNDIAVYGTD